MSVAGSFLLFPLLKAGAVSVVAIVCAVVGRKFVRPH